MPVAGCTGEETEETEEAEESRHREQEWMFILTQRCLQDVIILK